MSEPTHKKLYEKVNAEIYKKHQKHSAYRSGLLVQEYKRQGGTYKGTEKQHEGLNRWYKEQWKAQRETTRYKYKSDVYRPTIKVSTDTPTTYNEFTKEQISKTRRENAKEGRVKRFDE